MIGIPQLVTAITIFVAAKFNALVREHGLRSFIPWFNATPTPRFYYTPDMFAHLLDVTNTENELASFCPALNIIEMVALHNDKLQLDCANTEIIRPDTWFEINKKRALTGKRTLSIIPVYLNSIKHITNGKYASVTPNLSPFEMEAIYTGYKHEICIDPDYVPPMKEEEAESEDKEDEEFDWNHPISSILRLLRSDSMQSYTRHILSIRRRLGLDVLLVMCLPAASCLAFTHVSTKVDEELAILLAYNGSVSPISILIYIALKVGDMLLWTWELMSRTRRKISYGIWRRISQRMRRPEVDLKDIHKIYPMVLLFSSHEVIRGSINEGNNIASGLWIFAPFYEGELWTSQTLMTLPTTVECADAWVAPERENSPHGNGQDAAPVHADETIPIPQSTGPNVVALSNEREEVSSPRLVTLPPSVECTDHTVVPERDATRTSNDLEEMETATEQQINGSNDKVPSTCDPQLTHSPPNDQAPESDEQEKPTAGHPITNAKEVSGIKTGLADTTSPQQDEKGSGNGKTGNCESEEVVTLWAKPQVQDTHPEIHTRHLNGSEETTIGKESDKEATGKEFQWAGNNLQAITIAVLNPADVSLPESDSESSISTPALSWSSHSKNSSQSSTSISPDTKLPVPEEPKGSTEIVISQKLPGLEASMSAHKKEEPTIREGSQHAPKDLEPPRCSKEMPVVPRPLVREHSQQVPQNFGHAEKTQIRDPMAPRCHPPHCRPRNPNHGMVKVKVNQHSPATKYNHNSEGKPKRPIAPPRLPYNHPPALPLNLESTTPKIEPEVSKPNGLVAPQQYTKPPVTESTATSGPSGSRISVPTTSQPAAGVSEVKLTGSLASMWASPELVAKAKQVASGQTESSAPVPTTSQLVPVEESRPRPKLTGLMASRWARPELVAAALAEASGQNGSSIPIPASSQPVQESESRPQGSVDSTVGAASRNGQGSTGVSRNLRDEDNRGGSGGKKHRKNNGGDRGNHGRDRDHSRGNGGRGQGGGGHSGHYAKA